jgi:acyl-CoA synthetase (AMP-forming)/AMP-acid ligase II
VKPGTFLDEEGLRDFLANKLAPFKIPAVFNFSEIKLPRLGSEKFDKPKLRKMYSS